MENLNVNSILYKKNLAYELTYSSDLYALTYSISI